MEASRLADAVPAPPASESALARARVHRQLTREEAARRAGIREEEAQWLEEGRVYRFQSTDHALLATLLYASALEIDHREALELAGRPVPPAPRERSRWSRGLVGLAVVIVAAAVTSAVVLAHRHAQATQAQAVAAARTRSTLPPPWAIDVVVLNGSGDINYTRSVASKIGALGYQIAKVARASRFDYPQTIVFFPPHGNAIALRLAKQLGVQTAPLPGGSNPRRLVVIVGPPRGIDG